MAATKNWSLYQICTPRTVTFGAQIDYRKSSYARTGRIVETSPAGETLRPKGRSPQRSRRWAAYPTSPRLRNGHLSGGRSYSSLQRRASGIRKTARQCLSDCFRCNSLKTKIRGAASPSTNRGAAERVCLRSGHLPVGAFASRFTNHKSGFTDFRERFSGRWGRCIRTAGG
jgi:hypothetical protein